jgi:triphosphoribosyl-dephospho-CoA synthase
MTTATPNLASPDLIPLPCIALETQRANAVGALARQALLKEVELTPKPGLVDRFNNGAHRDMNLGTFYASVEAIAPWFPTFYRIGASTRHMASAEVLAHLRPEGRACEEAMLQATGGVNTHKGSIFCMGLLCAAVGRLDGENVANPAGICHEIARMCAHLVEGELARVQEPRTAGERLFREHGLTGIRGEAASGFHTVLAHSLPAFERVFSLAGEEAAMHEALLHLLAVNHDTNLVHRGGLAGLAYVQSRAKELLKAGGMFFPGIHAALIDFDSSLCLRNLSPGGSADLLSVTWLLFQLSVRNRRRCKTLRIPVRSIAGLGGQPGI